MTDEIATTGLAEDRTPITRKEAERQGMVIGALQRLVGPFDRGPEWRNPDVAVRNGTKGRDWRPVVG